MSKIEYIEKISSYLGDGFIEFPAGIRSGLEANGTTFEDFKLWSELAKTSLESIKTSNRLSLIPEGSLSNICSYIEQIRNATTTQMVSADVGTAESAFGSSVNQMEQLIYQIAPYLNLADNQNYRELARKVESTLETAQTSSKTDKKAAMALSANLKSLHQKSERLLRGQSSGVLSENFEKLSNGWWNWTLMALSLALSAIALFCLLDRSTDLTNLLIEAFSKGSLDYRIFLAKWGTTLPYLALLSVGVLELRSRIKARDIYEYRRGVAASLDAYTEALLNKVEDIKDIKEKSIARRAVIEFMINSMLELTKTPSIKPDKQSVAFKVKDLVEARASSD